jgi:hypothetical protein
MLSSRIAWRVVRLHQQHAKLCRALVACPLTFPFYCLFSRVLYGNKITDLPRGVFGGLYTLQLL